MNNKINVIFKGGAAKKVNLQSSLDELKKLITTIEAEVSGQEFTEIYKSLFQRGLKDAHKALSGILTFKKTADKDSRN